MKPFAVNRALVQNEFEEACWDETTGLSAELLFEKLSEMQKTETDRPRPIVRAEIYAWLLDNLQLQINPNTPFSVKFNLGIDYTGFASQDIFLRAVVAPQMGKIMASYMDPELVREVNYKNASGLGIGGADLFHTVPDWNNIVKFGFVGILKNAEASRRRLEASGGTEKQLVFLDSVIITFSAMLRMLERIYQYSLKFDLPEFSASVKRLTEGAPQTFYDVLQLSVFYLYFEEIGLEKGRTLGPIDALYLPFYEADIAKGADPEQLHDLIRYFFIHFTAAKRYAAQPFTLCGSDADGSDRTNAMSHLLLEIYDELNIYDPKIQIRCHKNLDDGILTKALDMIRHGNSSICLLNDEAVFRGYERLGIPRSDAQDYVLLGCYEPIIMGKEEAEISTARLNMVKCLEFALNGGRDMLTGNQIFRETTLNPQSFEAFVELFYTHLDDCMDLSIKFADTHGRYSTLMNPSPIYSASFTDCIEKATDVHEYPLPYNNLSLKCIGLATVVDSLTVLKKYVFERGELTLDEMRKILAADWEGYEELRMRIIKDKEKYGNNLPVPDAIMTGITKHLADKYCGMPLARGGKLRLALDSIDKCILYGKVTAASPDGRKAKTTLSKNLCATDGMDRGGITAYMQSVLKIDAADFVNAAVLDFVLHPSAVEGDKGLADFKSIIRIFFENGGFAIQGNIISAEKLRAAQNDPAKYSTLQIRVCGWNEYFVKLSRVKQDMFIRQCEGI